MNRFRCLSSFSMQFRHGRLFLQQEDEYTEDQRFRTWYRGASSYGGCLRGEFFVELQLEGRWRHGGGSVWQPGTSLLASTVEEVRLVPLSVDACTIPERDVGDPDKTKFCVPTAELLGSELCPCGGFYWVTSGDEAGRMVARDVLAECTFGGSLDCPVADLVLARKEQYRHYNATETSLSTGRPTCVSLMFRLISLIHSEAPVTKR